MDACIEVTAFFRQKFVLRGRVTMTTENSKSGTITLSLMNLSRYVRHVTIQGAAKK